MDKLDVLMVGVGGGGVILGSDIVAEAALAAGYDVKKTDVLGMAQRGGSVTSNIRIAPRVWAPLIKSGGGDVMIGFEKLEAARWVSYLRPDGVVVINDYAVPPSSVNIGADNYPSDDDVARILRMRTQRIYFVRAYQHALELGDRRTMNAYLLGCLSVFAPFIGAETWRDKIAERLHAGVRDLNLRAFELGREEIQRATA